MDRISFFLLLHVFKWFSLLVTTNTFIVIILSELLLWKCYQVVCRSMRIHMKYSNWILLIEYRSLEGFRSFPVNDAYTAAGFTFCYSHHIIGKYAFGSYNAHMCTHFNLMNRYYLLLAYHYCIQNPIISHLIVHETNWIAFHFFSSIFSYCNAVNVNNKCPLKW